MGGRLATCVTAATLAILFASRSALASEDDLALDLGSTSDKPVDAGVVLRRLEFRRIPSGTFSQGSPALEVYREPDEVERNVTITKTFWMGKYPVTRAQFARFVAETRHRTDAEKGQNGGFGWDGLHFKQAKEYTWRNPGFVQTDDDPVTLVTFGDANAFTAWASRKTGRRVRLPTEAEFEYAARGGTTTPWYGAKTEEEAATLGWYRPAHGAAVGTHAVGKKKANSFGLFDMTGNVYQWCRDVYAVWPASDAIDPENTTNTGTEPERRVLRGGSWTRDPRRGRSAARYRNAPGTRNADIGFRLVVEDAPMIAPSPGAVPASDVAPTALTDAPDATAMIAPPPPIIQRPSTGNEGISWALLAAPVGAVSFVIAWMLARRKREATNAQGITTRAAEDGFWVRAPNLPPSSRVRYTCIVKRSEVSDLVPLDGGEETFVFTGGEPSMIQISEAIAPPGGFRSSARVVAAPPAEPSGPELPVDRSPSPSDRGSVRSVGVLASDPTSAPPPAPSTPPSNSSPFLGYPGAY